MLDINKRLSVAKIAALRAGHYLNEKRKSTEIIASTLKGKNDIVTEMDRASETIIIDTIRSEFPRDDIFSEECGEQRYGGEGKWIIDPIDGTENYFRGYQEYAVSIGYEQEEGKPIIGVVYCPARSELYFAQKGQGAYLGDKPLKVSNIRNPVDAITLISLPFREHEVSQKYFSILERIFLHSRDVRNTGSAALHMCYVAAGLAEGYLEYGVYPYDVAGGMAILMESGGTWQSLADEAHPFQTNSILATNGFLQNWYERQIVEALNHSHLLQADS